MNALSEQIFVALDLCDHLEKPQETGSSSYSFQEVFSFVNHANFEPRPSFLANLKSNLALNRDINRLLRRQKSIQMGTAAAASTGDINHREANGFELTIHPSLSNPAHVYLEIKSIDRDEEPEMLFVSHPDLGTERLIIDDFFDGETQILLSAQDRLVKLLRNVESHVILRA
jgi:hypothetical protein